MEGGGNISNRLLGPLLKICSTSTKKMKTGPASSPAALASTNTFITRLKVVIAREDGSERKVELKEDYSHLIGHCAQQPTTLTWLPDLPDHLISLILCHLPLHEAVRTCILSKRWRYLWSLMPNLRLPEFASVDTITSILKLFKAPRVRLFNFNVLEVQGRFPTSQEINSWLFLVCSHQVEDLVLMLDFFDLNARHPCRPRVEHWFAHDASPGFSTLKRLTLRYCMLGPPASKHLTSLEYLAIERVALANYSIEELTSSCPMLRELKLMQCNMGVPLRLSITNPKTSKLTIYDTMIGTNNSLPVLELRAPYLSTLVVTSEVGRRYELNVPSLSTLKFANVDKTICFDFEEAALVKILSGLITRELYLCSMVLQCLSRICVREGLILSPPAIKVKHLHLQASKFPQELPGLVCFLKSCAGLETLILDFGSIKANRELNVTKHFRCLISSAALKDADQIMIEEKEKLVCLDDEHSWSSLGFILSSQMQDLKCIIINGFKRLLHKSVGKEYNSHDSGAQGCRIAVDKYEFKLLRLLLNYSLGLESITIRTKDAYLIEEVDEMCMETVISPFKCKNIYLDSAVDKMEISQWDKVLLSLSRGSPRAKINVTYG